MTPQEILVGAAKLLLHLRWCQGANYVDADGRRWMLDFLDEPRPDPAAACAVGAICLAGRDDLEARDRAIDLVELCLAAGRRDVRPCVSAWNDDRRRTKAEVVEVLRRAARPPSHP